MTERAHKDRDLAEVVARITGLEVTNTQLLRHALTHASVRGASANEYQRLEFLGDRVLGLVVAEMVFLANPNAPEGELSVRLNSLVNAETLAEIADESGISEIIQVAGDIGAQSGRKRINLRADVTEALIAVLYLEGGMKAASAFIHRYWQERAAAPTAARRDAKTELQEWAHRQAGTAPRYDMIGRSGPDHEPIFEVRMKITGMQEAIGSGRSKREAEQEAARGFLLREGVWLRQDENS